MEEFKDLPGYEGRYQVSNTGKVKSLIRNIILKSWKNKHGYEIVRISKGNNVVRCRTVHLLVAASFLDHHSDGTQKIVVDHIDGNKANNNLENLQLITQRENSIRSGFKGFSKHKKTGLFFSRIYIDGKSKSLGYYKTPEEAQQAYRNALKELNLNF